VGPPASPVPVSALQRPPEPPIPVATVLTRPVLPATLVGVVVPVEVTGSVATGTAAFPGSGTSPEEASSPRARAASDPGHGGRIYGHPDAAADEDTEVTASLPVLAADGVALADDGQRVPASEEPKPAARVIEAVTENGLPRRSRHRPSGATRPAVSVGQSRPPGELDLRLPEETRAMMASYQAGSEHGRQVAADEAVRGTVRGRPADLPTTTADDRGEDGS
jgi:hypothetical protein